MLDDNVLVAVLVVRLVVGNDEYRDAAALFSSGFSRRSRAKLTCSSTALRGEVKLQIRLHGRYRQRPHRRTSPSRTSTTTRSRVDRPSPSATAQPTRFHSPRLLQTTAAAPTTGPLFTSTASQETKLRQVMPNRSRPGQAQNTQNIAKKGRSEVSAAILEAPRRAKSAETFTSFCFSNSTFFFFEKSPHKKHS